MKKILLILVIFIFLFGACSKKDADTIKAKKIIEYNKKKFDNFPLSGKIVNGVREINVKALQFRWDPDTIVVRKGDKVRFFIESVDVPHGFELEGITIPGWDPDKAIKKDNKTILEITADEAGYWDMVCTVYCGPGHAGMRSKYIVKS